MFVHIFIFDILLVYLLALRQAEPKCREEPCAPLLFYYVVGRGSRGRWRDSKLVLPIAPIEVHSVKKNKTDSSLKQAAIFPETGYKKMAATTRTT